jgi:hypothetical protein
MLYPIFMSISIPILPNHLIIPYHIISLVSPQFTSKYLTSYQVTSQSPD